MTEKAARIAELEREIASLQDKSVECATTGLRRDIQVRGLEAELSRLRNASPALIQGEGSEPVGWRYRFRDNLSEPWSDWYLVEYKEAADNATQWKSYAEVRPLYASPPPLPAGPQPDSKPTYILGWHTVEELRKRGELDTERVTFIAASDLLNTALPLPAGNADPRVREAFDQAARVAEEWDSGWGEDRNTKVARQTAIEIAGAIRALPSPQSQGLVEAAEPDQEEIIFQALKKSPLDCRTERTQRLLAAEIHEALRSRASDRSA